MGWPIFYVPSDTVSREHLAFGGQCVSTAFRGARPCPARGGRLVLESARPSRTAPRGCGWSNYCSEDLERCDVGFTSTVGGVVVASSARFQHRSALGRCAGCPTRVGSSMPPHPATHSSSSAPSTPLGLVSHALTVCRRILPLGSTLHFHLVRARCDAGAGRANSHAHDRARVVRAMRRPACCAARSLRPRWRGDGRARLMHAVRRHHAISRTPCAQAS